MSKIDKLSILGVRSFDNIRSETIQFNTPLTLIVGYNGSGKTTIIECLKYATTGQLPPNSKGGAFIHDPKLCGEKEVLAQVKLSFKGTSGGKLVVTRSLQLTVKKAARSMKTLECQLLMIKDGERSTISSRVAEMDQLMPQYLGVSEAILDSVIFCHQDESLWPMSEPATLKKKFDEIFEAMKYTKAIANIKDLAKNQKIALGQHTILENTYKIDKDRGERCEKKSKALQDEIEELRTESNRLNEEIASTAEACEKKRGQALSFQNIVGELNLKRNTAQEKARQISGLEANLQEMVESDEWLESTLSQYEEKMAQYQSEKLEYTEQYHEGKGELEKSRKVLDSKLAEKGRYEADKAKYERDIVTRAALVRDSASQHVIRGFEGDLDDDLVREFIIRMSKLSRDKGKELEQIQKSINDELQQKREILSDLQNRKAARTQDKVSAKQAMAANDRKIDHLQDDIDKITVDEGAKVVLETTLRELQERRRKVNEDFEAAGWENQLQFENSKLRECEDEAERLNSELVRSTKLATDRAQLTYTKKQLKDRQQSLETLCATYNDKITSIVGSKWESATVEAEYQSALDLKSQEVTETQRLRDSATRLLEQVNFKLSTLRQSKKQKTEEMNQCKEAVVNSILTEGAPLTSVDDYLEELAQMEADRNLLKSDMANFSHTRDFFKKCLTVVEAQDKCHLCERKFAQRQEKSAAITALNKRLTTIAKELAESEVQKYDADLEEANAARPQYETYKRLNDIELPGIESDIKLADAQRSDLLSRLESLDADVKKAEHTRRDVESVGKTIASIARHQKEIEGLANDLSTLSSQQKSSGDMSRTAEDIQQQQASCMEQSRALKAKIARLTREKGQATESRHTLELELKEAERKINNTNQELKERHSLYQRIQELKESSASYRDTIERADKELEELAPKLARINAEIADIQQQGQAKAKEIRDEQDKISRTVNKLENADNEITTYIDGGGPAKLTSCERAIKTCEREMSKIEDELSQLTQKINKLSSQEQESGQTKRNIIDNIQYRKSVKEFQILNVEIAELESRNATEDYRRLQIEYDKLEYKRQKLLAERGPILGSMKAKDDELARLLQEWDSDFKDAARKYREAHVKVETTKAAIDDLNRYGKALDQAIMKYHSMKMEEINRIAGELWQSTYQGTDVDTILIRSEAENATAKRQYNYRVCMVKQDAEMDMRGRCSAGQRVLASIIIRLALAECFGTNCGLIALDEPTTNLDRDNIRALAESLNHIIKSRQAQSNFQLIVITHDEEFLKFMRCSDFCDTYYRVSRDDKQKSVIERQTIDNIV